jgi:phage terminase Nu1 subunit (DNA packaging protein)
MASIRRRSRRRQGCIEMISLGDCIAIFDWIRNKIEVQDQNSTDEKKRMLRLALRELHFSEKTIQALKSLDNYDVGRVAIYQRDNRIAVQKALEGLAAIENDKKLAIVASQFIAQITMSKASIREEIARTLHRAVTQGSNKDVDILIASIRSLNAAIENLDQQIGGIFL